MNKLVKNSSLIKDILFIILGSVLVLTSLSVYILSIVPYDGGFDASLDYLVILICSIIFLVYCIYAIVKSERNLTIPRILTLGLCSSIGGLYSLGVFFKAMTKALAKGKEFVYTSYQMYLYIGIVALILTLIAVFEYLETKKD